MEPALAAQPRLQRAEVRHADQQRAAGPQPAGDRRRAPRRGSSTCSSTCHSTTASSEPARHRRLPRSLLRRERHRARRASAGSSPSRRPARAARGQDEAPAAGAGVHQATRRQATSASRRSRRRSKRLRAARRRRPAAPSRVAAASWAPAAAGASVTGGAARRAAQQSVAAPGRERGRRRRPRTGRRPRRATLDIDRRGQAVAHTARLARAHRVRAARRRARARSAPRRRRPDLTGCRPRHARQPRRTPPVGGRADVVPAGAGTTPEVNASPAARLGSNGRAPSRSHAAAATIIGGNLVIIGGVAIGLALNGVARTSGCSTACARLQGSRCPTVPACSRR